MKGFVGGVVFPMLELSCAWMQSSQNKSFKAEVWFVYSIRFRKRRQLQRLIGSFQRPFAFHKLSARDHFFPSEPQPGEILRWMFGLDPARGRPGIEPSVLVCPRPGVRDQTLRPTLRCQTTRFFHQTFWGMCFSKGEIHRFRSSKGWIIQVKRLYRKRHFP